MRTGDEALSAVLSEFARTMVTDFPIQAILDRLVVRIVDVLPVAAAGVTLVSPSLNPVYVAASDDSALHFEDLQSELGEGPCLEAYRIADAVSVPDLRTDARFERFSSQALDAGLGAVFAFPLRHGDEQLGALALYRHTPGPLSPVAMAAAQTLADVAAAYILNARVRAELLNAAERAREVALHDALTGLPNRLLIMEHLDRALRRARRPGNTVAVLFADLDQLKEVNDRFGHRAGDELLVAVGERMMGVVRPGDTLARLSGDEFVIACEDLEGIPQAVAIAGRLAAAVAAPFVLSNARVSTTVSVGIAFADNDNRSAEDLLHDADLAMYQAKRSGGAAISTSPWDSSDERIDR